jgi:ribosomal protein S18 acetylase RimI-like enzyme
LGPGDVDAAIAASELFDYVVRPEWAERFLSGSNHHLCVAYEDGGPAGFVSGVETTHPDKGTEMFLYELSVGAAFRRQGIGRALVEALVTLARSRGCYGMWVLTERANEAAMATYRSAGAVDEDDEVMLGWRLDPTHESFRPD